MIEAPKAERPKPNTPRVDRFRNWRRVTPRVSGVGGIHGTGAVVPAVARAVDA